MHRILSGQGQAGNVKVAACQSKFQFFTFKSRETFLETLFICHGSVSRAGLYVGTFAKGFRQLRADLAKFTTQEVLLPSNSTQP